MAHERGDGVDRERLARDRHALLRGGAIGAAGDGRDEGDDVSVAQGGVRAELLVDREAHLPEAAAEARVPLLQARGERLEIERPVELELFLAEPGELGDGGEVEDLQLHRHHT